MSEYTFEFNARWNATQQVRAGLDELANQLRSGARELSSALSISPTFNPAELERMVSQLNVIGDRAIEQMRVAGDEIGQALQQGMVPSDTLGARLNTVLRTALDEARAQIQQFSETTQIVPGGNRAGEVLQFAETFQQTMLRSIQVVATELRSQLNAAAAEVGLSPRAITGQFQGARIASASTTQLLGALGTPETTDQFRERVDAQRQGASPAASAEQLVAQVDGLLNEAINAVIDGRTVTQEQLAALRAEGLAFDLRMPGGRGLTPISGAVGVRDIGQGAPSVYQLRPGEGEEYDPIQNTVQRQRALERANQVLAAEAEAGEAATAADRLRAQRTANLTAVREDPNAVPVGNTYRTTGGQYITRAGDQVGAPDPTTGTVAIEDQLRMRELDAQYLNLLRRRNTQMERLNQTQADNSFSGLLNRFAGGAGGVGFDAHAGFKPEEFLGNIAGTFGVLARYGGAGIGITAAFQGISAVRQEIVDYQTALVNLHEITQTTSSGQLDLNSAISAAAPAGIGAAEAINLGADALARYRQEVESGGDAGQILTTSLHNIAEAAVLTGQDAKTAAAQLMDATQGFGLGSGGQSRILDAVENARKNFGGDRGQIMQAIGDAGDLAASAGIDPEQLANMVALIQARTGASGTSVASSIERTISRQGTSSFRQALAGLGIEDTGNITNEIVQMSQAWDGLSKVQRDALVTQLGGARQARELLPLLQEGRQLLDANANSYGGAGAAAAQYAREQATLAGEIRQIGGTLRDVAQQLGQTGIFTFLGPTAIGIRDLVTAADEMLRVFNALPAPIREVGLTLAEAALAVRIFGNAEQQAALGGALGRIPVIGGFARRIGLPGASGGTDTAGGEQAASAITGAGATFAETVVAAARQVAVELGGAGGAAAAEGGAAAAGGEAVLAGNAAVVGRMQAMVQAQMTEAAAADTAAIEEETAAEVEARAAAAAAAVEAMVAGGEDVQVALAAVAQLINGEAVALEEAAAAVGIAAEELTAAMSAAAVGMSLQAGEGVMATGAMTGAVTGGLAGGGLAAMLTNPMMLAIGGLIAIGGITNHIHQLDEASAQAADALSGLATGTPSANDLGATATTLRATRQQLGQNSSGPLGTVAGVLDNVGGQRADLQRQANELESLSRRIQQDQSQRANLVTSSFGPSGTDVGLGLQSMAQNGVDAATQLQAVALALGVVSGQANEASTNLAGMAGHPNAPIGLQMSGQLVGSLASFAANFGRGGLEQAAFGPPTDFNTPAGRRLGNQPYTGPDNLVSAAPGSQPDISAALQRALAHRQTGDVLTDDDKTKIADAVVASYDIEGGDSKSRQDTRNKIRAAVLRQLSSLQAEAQQGGGPALTDQALGILLNGDGKNQPGLLSVIQAAKPDAFDPTGGAGAGGTLQNAVNILRNIVQRADPQGTHYPDLIAAYHDAEDKLAQATVSNLEKLRQAADSRATTAQLPKIDQSFFDREIQAAGSDTTQMIGIINNMTDAQIRVARAMLENALRVAEAAAIAIRKDPDLRGEVAAALATLNQAQANLGAFNAAQPYRGADAGSKGVQLTPAQQRDIARIQAGADPNNPVQSAQVALNAAQREEQDIAAHGRNTKEYWDAVAKVNQARNTLAQAQHSQAQAAMQSSVYPGSQVQQAAAQLSVAKDQVAAAERGTAAWYQAQQALLQAQVAYGNAVLADQDIVRQLRGDNTDPVFRAREAVRSAQAQLAVDRRRHAPADVLHRDELTVRDDTNAQQAAVFDQRMHDAQIAHDLGQMSDAAYLRFLEGQRDRLQAINHKTRQQFEELQQVDQALKSTTDALQGQWNLGDIKIPTPYEMKRAIQAQAQGQQYMSTAVTNYQFSINGADTALVRRIIESVVGQRAQVRTTTRTRKV